MSLLTNLVGYWRLGEATGATRLDGVATSHLLDDGSVDVVLQSGAAKFIGTTNENLHCASNSAIQMGNFDFTVAIWCFPTVGGNYVAVDKGGAFLPAVNEYMIQLHTTGTFARISNGTTGITATTTAYTGGAWNWMLLEYDATNDVLNVSKNNAAPGTQGGSTGGWAAGSADLRVGKRGPSGDTYIGLLRDLGIWKRLLTADEKTELYNAGVPGITYPFGVSSPLLARIQNEGLFVGGHP